MGIGIILCGALWLPPAVGSAASLDEATALEKAGKTEEAMVQYRELIKDKPSEELYKKAVAVAGRRQRYDEARQLLEQALQQFPESLSLRNQMAMIRFRLGQKTESLKELEVVLGKDPENRFAKELKAQIDKGRGVSPAPQSKPDVAVAAPVEPQAKSTKSLEEQKKLAKDLYKEMAALDRWALDDFIRLHQQVINDCPDTHWAEESYWRLSSLYMSGYSEPDWTRIIETLEAFLQKYPNTKLKSEVHDRLLLAYKETGNNDKLLEISQTELSTPPSGVPDTRYLGIAMDFAEAQAARGNQAEAKKMFEQIVQWDNGRDTFIARLARSKLNGN